MLNSSESLEHYIPSLLRLLNACRLVCEAADLIMLSLASGVYGTESVVMVRVTLYAKAAVFALRVTWWSSLLIRGTLAN